MAVLLDGGCRVSELLEGTPEELGTVRAHTHFGIRAAPYGAAEIASAKSPATRRNTGAIAISLRVLRCAPGRSPELGNASGDEVLYSLEGAGTLVLDGERFPLEPDAGFYLPPGSRFAIENHGVEPVTLVGSRCPDPGTPLGSDAGTPTRKPAPPLRLFDQPAEVTGDRWYRVLVDGRVGSHEVTQFVGSIPPGRAPAHFHEYEEVLCILSGVGRMWAGRASAPIARGSCIFLPRRQVHCVENTGEGELRLLGVFYPAGSPAVRYDPAPS